jgi:hypothetical protein
MLSLNVFDKYTKEMEVHFGKKLGGFARSCFYQYLSGLTDKEYVQAVVKAISEETFMPSAKKLFESVRGRKVGLPEENRQAYKGMYCSLPSEQMNMTDEQRLENIRRIKEIAKGLCGMPKEKQISEDNRKIQGKADV